ncbi:hypothetical protein J5N97_025171 [Dioscorea zingiberensis]|uniref:Mediator of RNA polymerase II transcription subunit 13 n=1 Tax=Dioscorea zingiberensis TaxID=325984 RepID=A0A9D5H9E8_9LILI|nr:hypothetical protein J5N97_025171 [Dioscorea zingiberensis]
MWTNVFRIGEQLRTVSWFQFLPSESDVNNLPDISLKVEQKDAATCLVLSGHLQLQNEGFLSTWTNSFVGPWDPSQGVHNPDEKIKLWLFIPGRHSSVSEKAQAAVSRLKVVGTGLWVAPGDSDEVAAALSQALKNSLERSLRLLSYMRFGDVFTRCHNFTLNENNLRRALPTIEFVFAATEEAIYVHAVISAKYVRGLCSDDMEKLLKYRSSNSVQEGIPVIVAPNGMRGRLIGCRPSDLVKQVYASKVKVSNGLSVGIPFHVAQSSVCQLRGQSFYAEVTLGCPSTSKDCSLKSVRYQTEVLVQHNEEQHQVSSESVHQKQGSADKLPLLERTFLYPAETVLLPVMQRAFARSSLKRLWLQNSVGTPLFELWSLWNFSGSSHLEYCLTSGEDGSRDFIDCLGVFSGLQMQRKYNSSSNSNSSSISSISSTSSESDNDIIGANDLEADADSLTSKQSGLASNDQFENDGHKMVSKRVRTGMTETFGQAGTVVSGTTQDPYKSDYSVAEVGNSAAAGVQIGSNWGWDDDGINVDIQMLLSEFGDFGDFFENDVFDFGEPPGTAESQAIMFPSADSGDVSGSPGGLDVADQKFSPVTLSSFEAFTHPFATPMDDVSNRSTESTRDFRSSGIVGHSSAPSSSKFDYLIKAEAMMIFAPEYAAVKIPTSEPSTSVVRNTYLPRSKRVDSLSSGTYFYSATPLSPCKDSAIEKNEISLKAKPNSLGHDGNLAVSSRELYTYIDHGMRKVEKRPRNHDVPPLKRDVTSPVSVLNSATPVLTIHKKSGSTFEAGQLLLSLKTTLATEIDCIMFQAAMCKIRHTLLSLSNRAPLWSNKLIGSVMSEIVPVDTSTITNSMPSRYEAKRKDPVPVRIAGDVDVIMTDGPVTAPVGVWRSVGTTKGPKALNTFNSESAPTLPHSMSNADNFVLLGQRQPLQELLDAMALLVQQSTSFVDVSLDADDGEGSFCWLALQEQQRRSFSCGPSMVHAGCGGLLAVSHSLDIAGVELIDPLSADVQVSSAISLLQSDIKVALKHAFGNLDGPLSVTDWCKGRSSLGDLGNTGDGYPFQSPVLESKDPSGTLTLGGEPMSPPQSTGGPSCLKDGSRIDDSSQRRSNQERGSSESEPQKPYCNFRPTLSVLPLPPFLVGYQDDWLKTSVNCLQFWDKAPLEPYALPKPVTYFAICPDIDFLTTSATDFFQQLGVVYETCKLGTHSPQISGSQMELSPGKYLPSGLVLVDCPQQVKVTSNSVSATSSTKDYFQALAKGWDRRSFIKSLTKVLKDLKLVANSTVTQKEGTAGPITVVYVVCPFPEPISVLQTLIECCATLGSSVLSPFKDRRSFMHSQVAKALNCTTAVDEASTSNVIVLSGFSIPKLVLQIVTVESLLRINRPANELAMLKDIAFTVYNKSRRIPRVASTSEMLQTTVTGRSQPSMMHVTSPIPGLWKEFGPRISGPTLTREGDLDNATLRPGPWDNSWQTSRTGGLNCDTNRPIDLLCQEETRFMFEPLLILAEPGSAERGTSSSMFGIVASESSSSKTGTDDSSGIYMQTSTPGGSLDIGISSAFDKSEHDQKAASLHCCYGWTEDWRWLVCIWTDSRGELLDSSIFPFGGISSRQDTKVLQCLFVQVLHQGCQILSSSSDAINVRPRDIIIARVGSFFELECQEWQRAIYSVGGGEVKKWPLQFRRSAPDGISSSSSASSLQQQDMGLIQDRNLPSSPSPSLYSPHAKPSSFMKGGLGQANSKKQLLTGQTPTDSSRGFLHLVQSITLVGVSIDHCLNLITPADLPSAGGGSQNSSGSAIPGYVEGFSPVKSLGSMPASYLLIPSPSIRFLPSSPLQLPTCLTSESPPLAHLLHSKGLAIPLSTGFVVSKAVPSARRGPTESIREDRPSVLSISLVDHYGGSNNNNSIQEKMARGTSNSNSKQSRSFGSDVISRDYEADAHLVLESVAAELHSLSWMTASPLFLERRTALPFHCDMFLRLRRLLYYADKEFSRSAGQTQQ